MQRYILPYLVTATIFLAIDFVWLSIMAPAFYRPQLGEILLADANIAVAAIFYLFYVIGVLFFASAPALREMSVKRALINGALFGGFAYATYDITNLATLVTWSVPVVIVDILWGMFISAVTAFVGYKSMQRFAA